MTVLHDFAKLLAAEPDDRARKRLISRANLLAVQEVAEEVFEPPIRTLGQYLEDPIEVPPILVHPYMCVRGGLNVSVGRSGLGKTVMSLNRLMRWSCGLPMFDDWLDAEGTPYLSPVDGPIKTLIVENEGAAGMFHRQVGLMLNAENKLTDEHRKLAKENLWIWKEGGYSNLKLDDQARLDELRLGIEKWKPDMVFIEPFRSLWAGEENSATEMTVVVDALIAIAADYNCGVWASHHERKGGQGEDNKMSAARGSTVLENFVTVMENFDSVADGGYRELSWSKSRHGVAPPPVRMEWDPASWWYKWVPEANIETVVIDSLQNSPEESFSIKDISEMTGETQIKLRKVLPEMEKSKKLVKSPSVQSGSGSSGVRYRLPSTGVGFSGGLAI